MFSGRKRGTGTFGTNDFEKKKQRKNKYGNRPTKGAMPIYLLPMI